MKISKRVLILGTICIAVIGVIFFIHTRHKDETQGDSNPENRPAEAAVAVVQRAPAESSITVPGVFQAYQDILVHAKVSGYVKNIFVDIGDRVHIGEVLAVLEVPELNAQVQSAAAGLSRDESELQRASHDVARAEAAHAALHSQYARLKTAAAAQSGLIAEQELDDAQAKDLASEANIEAAKSTYGAAEGRLSQDRADLNRYKAMESYSYVRAPFNGVVTFRYADTGALIAAGTAESTNAMPIVRLAQSEVLRLRMPIPESDANYMKVGMPVVVQVQPTGETLHTYIVRFTRSLDGGTRTMLTEVDIPNHDLHLVPGMYASATFPLKHDENAMVVPIGAVVEGDQPYVLAVNEQNLVEKKSLVLGIQGANFYEVIRGVKIGDRVIVGNQANFQPGEKVSPSAVDMNLASFQQTSRHLHNLPEIPAQPGSTAEEKGGQK